MQSEIRSHIDLIVMLAVLATALLVWITAASAQEDRPASNPIARFDTDGDGKISRKEFPGPDEAFAGLDTNRDGVISAEEAAQGAPRQGRSDTGKGHGGPGRMF